MFSSTCTLLSFTNDVVLTFSFYLMLVKSDYIIYFPYKICHNLKSIVQQKTRKHKKQEKKKRKRGGGGGGGGVGGGGEGGLEE